MKYQPGLDGLRAVSVLAVIVYHVHALDPSAHWMIGGYLGVEVFFVVSGYLITSLLIDEHRSSGGVSLGDFWRRRARRLLPALFTVMIAVGAWAAIVRPSALFGLRRDTTWALVYMANWGQIFGKQSYFAGAPSLLRHLWSLAVEEQWYVVWPLVFVAIARRLRAGKRARADAARIAGWLAVAGGGAFVLQALVWQQPTAASGGDFRQNLVYLGTPFRAGGLLLGAASAFVWQPWRWRRTSPAPALDLAGFCAVGVLAILAWTMDASSSFAYHGGLLLVALCSVVAIATVVHPSAVRMQAVFGSPALVAVGRRSYGLYLWHWPIFAGPFASASPVLRLVGGGAATAVLSELCYRYVETPVRKGAIERVRTASAQGVRGVRTAALACGAATCVLVGSLALRYTSAEQVDAAVGGEAASIDESLLADLGTDDEAASATEVQAVGDSSGAARPKAPPAKKAKKKRRRPVIVLVGDSQAHSLSVNQPNGLNKVARIVNGAVEGCGVFESGKVLSSRPGWSKPIAGCAGFSTKWARSARRAKADVAMVMLGAWDVFDIARPAGVVKFGTPEWDKLFLAQLAKGVNAVRATKTKVAILAVPCMRPVSNAGAVVPPLPERADDRRVAHVNALLRGFVKARKDGVSFVAGPKEWCADKAISTSTSYRWDGVHVYRAGAKLIFDSVIRALVKQARS